MNTKGEIFAKEELLNREHPPVWSDFSLEVVNKTILMSDFGFREQETDLFSKHAHPILYTHSKYFLTSCPYEKHDRGSLPDNYCAEGTQV